jgi:hypothetical protein
MSKFLATYQMPSAGLDAWMKLPEEERKLEEKQMQDQWNTWLSAHKDSIIETVGVGKPKRVTKGGIADARNDIMMYTFVEAPSLDEAAKLFEGHPHFGIPEAWIEVMPLNKNVGQ